jgi:hypothetical protein
MTQRRVPQRRVPHEPQRTLQLLMSGLGALIMVGICGLSGFFIIADERRGLADDAAAPTPMTNRELASRALDPAPLSLNEVFPAKQIRLAPAPAPYTVSMTHIDTDCDVATIGALGAVLGGYGCSQVVRAGMTAPYAGYEVTAGIFNLADEAGATQVSDHVRTLVETGEGSFAAMAASAAPGLEPKEQPLSQVGWQSSGHYLLYCVISRPDNGVVLDDDPNAQRISADLLEQYLDSEIIGARRLDP